ncbi:hypothetical protein NG701_04990 [Pseudarthrobacter sp. HLT3-5]|uniref:hypothetical protein n=1 Tax=Pseudarthrobacter cellobiosi TaxID=2953654 RepID=UPI00208E24A9|nr:hypothetical protein [Pseudarthrobacter sp. HLT3-5]MCO4273790.1 hypothetical protein [Pseudarthrobacter sp. HLT3-5]
MSTTYPMPITISNRRELDQMLDSAVEAAIEQATQRPGAGILVTRHNHRSFSLSFSQEVPYGTIMERDMRPSFDTRSNA